MILPSDIPYLRECFEVRDDGRLIWRARPESHFKTRAGYVAANKVAGIEADNRICRFGYRTVCFRRTKNARYEAAHRVVFAITNGWLPEIVDHIDCVRSNNAPSNLRAANASINAQNMRTARASKPGKHLGVFYRPDKSKRSPYYAIIAVGEKRKHIGVFATADEAYAAYVEAKRRLHVGCTL